MTVSKYQNGLIEHSEACDQKAREFERNVQEWEGRFPNYCRACSGTGVSVTPGDHVPYGATTAQLPDMVDPCPECVEENRCGRCGSKQMEANEADSGDSLVCKECEWTDNEEAQAADSNNLHHPDAFAYGPYGGPCDCEFEWQAELEKDYGG